MREDVRAQLLEARTTRRPACCSRGRAAASRRRRRSRSPSGPSIQPPRRFHSRGTVQSKTGVPVGVSTTSSGSSRASTRERVPDAVAREAARDREELAHQLHELAPDRLGGRGRYPSRSASPADDSRRSKVSLTAPGDPIASVETHEGPRHRASTATSDRSSRRSSPTRGHDVVGPRHRPLPRL